MVLGSTAGAIPATAPVDDPALEAITDECGSHCLESGVADERAARRAALARVADRARPVTLAREQRLPVLDPLAPLLPDGGLRRGAVVGVEGVGATSLLLSLLAGPSAAGSWVALVGLPQVGLAAAAELGVVLDQVAVVADPPASRWAATMAALIDAFDVVALRPGPVRPQQARRLAARARERGAVLALARGRHRWGEGPDVRLAVVDHEWQGLEWGHGHLRARRLTVAATGRRDAARPRSVSLWLTDGEGRVTAAPEPAAGRRRRSGPTAPVPAPVVVPPVAG
jgi:hypothetical protein